MILSFIIEKVGIIYKLDMDPGTNQNMAQKMWTPWHILTSNMLFHDVDAAWRLKVVN